MPTKLPYNAELIEARDITDGVVYSREWYVLIRDPLHMSEPFHLPLPGATRETADQLAREAISRLADEQNWSE